MEKTTSADGTPIAYRVIGDGPLGVVFVHGWTCTGNTWNETLDQLPKDGRRIVVPDLRGHGGSAGDDLDHSVRRYAEDIVAAADAAGLERFVTIGHSMGGKYAQYVRVIAGERVIAHIGVAPTPSCTVSEGSTEEEVEHMTSGAGYAPAWVGLLDYITKNPLPDDVKIGLADEAATLTKEVLASSMRTFSRTDYTDELADAPSVPTLIIGGSADPFYPPTLLEERIAVEAPSARLVVVDSGHDPLHETSEELASLIDDFLTEVSS
ncbi:MAG: alpha/beta hydrolase [Microbacterium sp.]